MKRTLVAALFALLAWGSAQDLASQVVRTYADIVFASYRDALTRAMELRTAIDAFVADPGEDTHRAAKEAWLAAREPYGQTEAYRFYGGPIDDRDGPESLLNGAPLDGAYIDYVIGAPNAGIINDPIGHPTIDPFVLVSLNEGDSENISTGYHAIEFLLWGQDLATDGSGQRSFSDYTVAANAERRGAYLQAAAEVLVGHLGRLVDAWNPEIAGNYRETFLTDDPEQSLARILTGIGVLAKSELGGERIFLPYDNRDQAEEHSDFSDTTHLDIAANVAGIRNVYLGSYTRIDGSRIDGTGLQALVEAEAPELADRMQASLAQVAADIEGLPLPFDRAILDPEDRPEVLALVRSLFELGDTIAEVGAALGVSIDTALPK